MNIKVKLPSGEQLECRAVIAIPQVALSDATYIRTFTTGSPVRSKHEFHTLAQIALIQFDDDEIQLQEIIGEINLIAGKDNQRFRLFPRCFHAKQNRCATAH